MNRLEILGVTITPTNLEDTVSSIAGWVGGAEPGYVCLAAAHSIMACQADNELLRAFNGSSMTVPDGMALVWLLRRRGFTMAGRVYGADLMESTCDRLRERGHFFLVGEEGGADGLAEMLRARHSGLKVVGAFAPPFLPIYDPRWSKSVDLINASGAEIVWVGLGTGKQEKFMAMYREKPEPPVLISVGAAFDFLSGLKPRAPVWMRRSGLEWLFRLATEPRRLWPCYREYPRFALLLLAEALGFGNDKS